MVGKQHKKRAPSFSSEELEVLLDEVSLHKVTLFSSFRNNLCNSNKKELWSDIARKMAASGSGTPRSWQDVRKKWHDFSSQVKVRGSAVRRDRARTGAGTSSVQPLTAHEEKALAIMGDTISHGIPGGIDVRRGDAEQASCSRSSPPPNVPCSPDTEPPAALSSPGSTEPEGCTTPPPPVHTSSPGLRYTTLRRRSTISPCRCSEELVNIEKEKLVVLQDIQHQLTEANELARQSLELKRAKLELAKQQHALAEAQFNRPSISVPILLPAEGEPVVLGL